MSSTDDPWEISDEEFEAAKAALIEKHGAIPPSLQRVIDQGGRFAGPSEASPDAARFEFHISDEDPGVRYMDDADDDADRYWPERPADLPF
jgi:hypothetical protein